MTRALTVLLAGALLGAFAACPPATSVGRAYRCSPDGGAAQCDPWRCRLDGYCHDPALGEALPCRSADDCGGGWFCAKDAVCRDPAVPAPLACDSDSDCAGGWRCSTESTCVDPGEAALVAAGAVQHLLLQSPRLPPQDQVAMGPFVVVDEQETFNAIALVAGARLRVIGLKVTAGDLSSSWDLDSAEWVLDAGPTSLAVSWPAAALGFDGGTLVARYLPDAGRQVLYATAAPAQAWALRVAAPDDGVRPFAVSTGLDVRVVASVNEAPVVVDATPAGAEPVVSVASVGPMKGDGASLAIPLAVLTPQRLVTLRASDPGTQDATKLSFSASRPGIVSMTPLDLRATPDGFAVLVEVRSQGGPSRAPAPFVGVSGWDERGGLPVPKGSSLPDGGTSALLSLQAACAAEVESLADFAVTTAGTVLVPEVLCVNRETGRQTIYRGLPLRPVAEREPGLADGRAPSSHVSLSRRGHLSVGDRLSGPMALTLDGTPDWVAQAGGAPLASRGGALYRDTQEGLLLAETANDEAAVLERVADSTEEPNASVVLFRAGFVGRFAVDGGTEALFIATGPRTAGASAGAWHFRDGAGTDVLVAARGDAVFTGARDAGLAALTAVTRPAAGFDITAMALSTATDAGAFEGWAVANARLFRLVARGVDRWASTELPMTGVDPVNVWFDGARGRVASTAGVVYALPQRVPLSESLTEGVSSVVGACGTAFALKDGELLTLGPTDGGLRPWLPVPPDAVRPTGSGLEPAAPREAEAGRLYTSQGRVFVASTTGLVYEVRLSGCAR